MATRFLLVTALCALMFLGFSAAGTASETVSVEVHCRVLEYETRQPIAGLTVTALKPLPEEELIPEGTSHVLRRDIGEDELSEGIQIEAAPNAPFQRRSVSLRRRGSEIKEISRAIRLYLLPEQAPTGYGALDIAVQQLDAGEVEEAWAVFELAFRRLKKPDDVRQYGLKVQYNFARSLQRACVTYGYATCGRAKQILNKLLVWSKEKANDVVFRAEGLTRTLIQDAINDIDDYEKQENERRLLAEFSTVESASRLGGERIGVAARQVDTILASYDENATTWRKYGKTKRSLLKDAHDLWLRFSGFLRRAGADSKDQREALSKSLSYNEELRGLGDTSTELRVGKAVAQRYLSEIEGDA